MPAETSSSYSRELITNGENREKAVQEMRAEKGHVTADKAKTPEQKKELSEKWLKRAGLTEGGGKAEIMKLLGNPKTPEEFVAAVEKKQEEYGLKKDGILGWATLEKMDGEVDQSDNDDEFDSYKGLARAEAKAAKSTEEAAETQDKKDKLNELQRGIDDGAILTGETAIDPNGRQVTLQDTKDGKKWVVTEEGPMKGQTLNTETGEYEGTSQQVLTEEQIKKHGESFTTTLRSGTEAQLKNLKDVHGNPVTVSEQDDKRIALGTGENEGKIYNPETGTYELTTEQIKKQGEDFATKLRNSKEGATDLKDVHGDPVKVIEQDDRMVALGTGKNEGKIYNPETGTYELTKEEQEKEQEKKLYAEHNEDTRIANESYLTKEDNDSWSGSEKLNELKLSEVKSEIEGSDDFSEVERNRVNRIMDNINEDIDELGDITMGEYLTYARNPSRAADRFAPTDKPGKLPGKLGEYGATYQRGNLRKPDGSARENTFVYREGKVPQVIVDGEAKNINTVYTAPGVYKLPNGELYRVTMSDEGSKMAKVEDELGNNVTENVTSDGKLAKVG